MPERTQNTSNPRGSFYIGKDLEAMSFAQNYHRWILNLFAPYLGKNTAEIGAGMGNFSELLLTTQIERLHAFEPSNNMFISLQQKLSGDPRAYAIHNYFQGRHSLESLDSILYINVLEHIAEDDAELIKAREALCRHGHLLLFVPALSWLYSNFDREVGHFRRYSKKTLIHQVKSAGFNIIKAQYLDIFGIIPWYFHFVLMRGSMGSRNVFRYDRWIVPFIRTIEHVFPPPIGKNIVLIAQKS